MNDEEKRKAMAALKIGKGVWTFVSGGLLTLGHGLWAGVLKRPAARMPFAGYLLRSGEKSVKEGWAEWNK